MEQASILNDLFTRFVYVDGLRTKMWVDIDGDNVEDAGTDQVTLYTYGVAKGASAGDSKIASGHHLWKVQYPDSSGGTDVVSFAYNAQGQQIYTKDQAGNVIESDYDTSGRTTHKRATTIQTGSGFDDHVKRISTTYGSLGRMQLITQYDHATPGSGTVRDEIKYSYDDWSPGGPVALIEQDVDSAVGAGTGNGDYEVSYSWAKATTGRNTIRPDGMVIPGAGGLTIAFGYTGGMVGPYDDAASRVGRLTVGGSRVAMYDYLGVGHLVGVEYPETDLYSYRYSGSPAAYGDLDRFNRVAVDDWHKDLADPSPGDQALYNVANSFDRNGNVTVVNDGVHAAVDVQYTIDSVNRLTKAEEGTWNGSAITSRSRQQLWTLTQTGNWSLDRIDLNGDNDFADPGNGDVDDSRTHNEVNELTDRDLDTDGDGYDDAHYDLVYDAAGNLTDDAAQYEYVYDVWGRLRKVKNTSSGALIEEYWYYGNGWRKTMHYDTTGNGVVDGSDQKYHFVYDQQWRNVATFRGSDADPKEQFIYNAASGSKLDDVFLRNRDMTNGWAGAADGTLEQGRYMCTNWRGDVVAVLTDTGTQVEQVRYSAYGVPFGRYAGDADSDGDLDAADATQIQTWINAPAYDVRGDLDLDGDVDAADKTACQSNAGFNLGRGKLSLSAVGNRKGYGGYEADIALEPLMHVRHRVLHTTLGRWTRRDPIGYVDGPNLYGYARENPMAGIDPMGTDCRKGGATGGDPNDPTVNCIPNDPPGGGFQLQPMPIFAQPIGPIPGEGGAPGPCGGGTCTKQTWSCNAQVAGIMDPPPECSVDDLLTSMPQIEQVEAGWCHGLGPWAPGETSHHNCQAPCSCNGADMKCDRPTTDIYTWPIQLGPKCWISLIIIVQTQLCTGTGTCSISGGGWPGLNPHLPHPLWQHPSIQPTGASVDQ